MQRNFPSERTDAGGQDETSRHGIRAPFHPEGEAITNVCRPLLDFIVLVHGTCSLRPYGVPCALLKILLGFLILLGLVHRRQGHIRDGRKKVILLPSQNFSSMIKSVMLFQFSLLLPDFILPFSLSLFVRACFMERMITQNYKTF